MNLLKVSILTAVLLLATLAARASTTVTVTTTADGPGTNPLTLRAAINNANNAAAASLPYIIQVPPGTYRLTEGQLDLGYQVGNGPANNILIVGTGTAASTVITQSDNFNRVFNLDPNSAGGQTFALANLTITGGHDTQDGAGGAGILTGQASLTLPQDFLFMTNCVVSNNVTTGIAGQPGPGAGLGSDGGSTTLVGCTFVNNTVSSQTSGNLQGAGVTFQAWNAKDTLTAINCQFLQNAINASGANQYAEGAGLYLQHEGASYPTAHLTNCLFAGNVTTMANFTSTGLADYGGGGIYLDTGSKASIIGCTFSNNAAIGATGGASGKGGNGGAILAAESQASATIEFCRFVGNAGAPGGASNIWSSTATAVINANDNWWGSDAGPASGANVNLQNLTDWLFLTNTAAASSVLAGGTDALTVSFLKDSAGNSIPASSLSAFTNLPVTFTATDGSLTTSQALIQANGTATDTFTGTTAGSGHETASFDAASSTAAITVLGGVTSLSSSPTLAYYRAGATVPITVAFGGNVTVSGSPQLALADGGTAVYASGSGTATLTFNYVVGTGDTSSHLDYASTAALTLNGGAITAGGAAVPLTLPAPGAAGSLGANTMLVIDTTPPAVVISAPSVTSTNTGSVGYTVTFSDANLYNATLAEDDVTAIPTGTASLTNVTVTPGTGTAQTTNFTVTLSGLAGNGTLAITIPAEEAVDLAGNNSAAATSASVTVFIPPAPVVTSLISVGKGAFQFSFTNNPNASFSILSSTNLMQPLTNWAVVGAPTNHPPGVFQYTSLPTTNDPVRFYRIRAP